MTRLTKVCLLLIAIILFCDITFSKPLFEGINIERKLNIDFKPIKFKPISFIKEKWGPFGRFIKKHTIERRDLDDINIIDKGEIKLIVPAVGRTIPVVEKVEEPLLVPSYRPPVLAVLAPSVSPPASVLNTDISSAIPSNPYFTPAGADTNFNSIVEPKPIEGTLIVPPQEKQEDGVPPQANNVEKASPPPPRPGIISFFRELFSELMARFIARARASFSQLASPPVQQ